MDKAAFDSVLETASNAIRPAQLPGRPARLPNNVRRNNLLAANAASFSPMRLNSLSRPAAAPAQQAAAPAQQAAATTPVRLPNNVRRNNLLAANASNFESRLNPPIRPITEASRLETLLGKPDALQSPVAAEPSPRQVDPGMATPPRWGGLPSPDVANFSQNSLRLPTGSRYYGDVPLPGRPSTASPRSSLLPLQAPSISNVERGKRQLPRMLAAGTTPALPPVVPRSQNQQQYVSAAAPRLRGIAPRLDQQNARYEAGAGTLADTLAAKRVNGQGVWSGTPTPQAQQEYAAAVQAQRAANPDPRLRFLRNESGFRPGAGRTAVADKLRQQYLLNPMTAGRSGDMGDRFARLDAIDLPGRARQESAAVAANQRSYREARDAAINAQLQQGGYDETRLREEALARRQPRMEFGGADAASLLAPRTRITWEHGGKQHSMLTGPGRAPRTPEDEARSAYSRRRDVDAVRERLARARAARLAMRGYSR